MALYVLYLLGVAAFAATGVMVAHEARMDAFGAMVLAYLAGLGGGTTRDLILDRTPMYWTQDPVLLGVIAVTALLTMLRLRRAQLPRRTLLLVDALGLGVVTVIGAQHAIAAGAHPAAVIILATLTGLAGELVRDVLAGHTPPLLLTDEIYALAAASGAGCYLMLDALGLGEAVNTAASAGLIIVLRLVALRRRWRLPTLPAAASRHRSAQA